MRRTIQQINLFPDLQTEAPKIVIVGASNLVSLQKLPLVACNCETLNCSQPLDHLTGIPPLIDSKIIAQPGAKFNHSNFEKEDRNLFAQALELNLSTIVLYMDLLMNSLTVAPWLNPLQHKPQSPESVIHILKGLERKANAKDIRFRCCFM